MKLSTLLLIIVAAGIWLHIYLPAPGAKPAQLARNATAPMVNLVGRVMEKTPEGLIINCPRDTGVYYATGGAVNAFGRFLIKGHPNEGSMTGGEVVTVLGADAGTCYSSSEMLQAYRYVGAGTGRTTQVPTNPWHSALDEPTTHSSGRSAR